MSKLEQARLLIIQCQQMESRINNIIGLFKTESAKNSPSKAVINHCFLKLVNLRDELMSYHRKALELIQITPKKEEAKEEQMKLLALNKMFMDMEETEINMVAMLQPPEGSQLHQQSTADQEKSSAKVTHRPFDVTNPRLWIKELEHHFTAQAVSCQVKKFLTLLRLVGDEQSQVLAPITLSTQNYVEPFESAKEALLTAFELSKFQRLQQLFSLESEDEEKPSHLLGRIDLLLGDVTLEDIRKWLLHRTLSPEAQVTLSHDDSLVTASAYAMKADLLMKSQLPSASQICVVSSNKKKSTKGRENFGLCHIHLKYGDQAYSCAGNSERPCPMWRTVRPKRRQGNAKDQQ